MALLRTTTDAYMLVGIAVGAVVILTIATGARLDLTEKCFLHPKPCHVTQLLVEVLEDDGEVDV